MAAVTIRHSGLILSGQTVRGVGRPGSVGIHILPGLDLVVIHACTIRGFDIGVWAESPALIVCSELFDYGSIGIALLAASSYVEFCSFLDVGKIGPGAAIVALGISPDVRSNCFLVDGAKRYFGIGDPRRAAWDSKNNVGKATLLFGQSGASFDPTNPKAVIAAATPADLPGVVDATPGYGDIRSGLENLRLLPHSPALRLVSDTGLPAVDSRYFDAATRLPVVDRLNNRRAVEFVTAGAHEMSFSLTRDGTIRVLELLGGISNKPFDRAASGKNGVFLRLPGTSSNPGDDVVENPLDIQPSGELAVLSFRDARIGASALYFKPEKDLKVPFLVSAPPSPKSDMNGVSAFSSYGWVKALSRNADIILHKPGLGRAQYRPVLEVALRFRGAMAPNFSVKTSRPGGRGIDYTMVAESAALRTLVEQWIAADKYFFIAATWDRGIGTIFVGAQGDAFLRAFSTRPFVLDEVTEQMVGGVVAPDVAVLDPNDSSICFGSAVDASRGWHGYIDDFAIDIGQGLQRADLEAIFALEDGLPDVARILREVPQTDLVMALRNAVYVKTPGAVVAEIPSLHGYFDEIARVVSDGSATYFAARRHGGEQWGVFSLQGGVVAVLLENISLVYDLKIDRRGHLVIVANDIILSRLDPVEGIRWPVIFPSGFDPFVVSVAVGLDNEYYLGIAGGPSVLTAPEDISSTDIADVEPLDMDSDASFLISQELGGDGFVYGIDAFSGTFKLIRFGSIRTFDTVFLLGVDVAISVGNSLSIQGVDFTDLGVRPGDRISFVSAEGNLTTPEGEVVAPGDAITPNNASLRLVTDTSEASIQVDVPFVAEVPDAGRQFEVRIFRRQTIDAVVAAGAPFVNPSGMAPNPYDTKAPIYVSDNGAQRDQFDPALGVVFAFRTDSGLQTAQSFSTLGIDLSTIVDVSVRDNVALPKVQIAASLRSRLVWHMEYSSDGVIKNAAFPGQSDLVLPKLTLNDLIVVEPTARQVVVQDGVAVLTWSARFGPTPELDAVALNDTYENLSELGIVTSDGVLLARTTLARMPYDPLAETRTDYHQTLRVAP